MIPGVPSGDLQSGLPENGSFTSSGNEERSVSGKRVCHVDVSGQEMRPLEALSTGSTSSELPARAISLSDSEATHIDSSDSVISAAGESDLLLKWSGPAESSRSSDPGIRVESQLKEHSDKTSNALISVDKSATHMVFQEDNPILKKSPDTGYVEKSSLTRTATPEDVMAVSRLESIRMQPGVPDVSSGSGAKPKVMPVTSRKKKKQREKTARNMKYSDSVKGTATVTVSSMPSAGASVQNKTEGEKVATSQSSTTLSIPPQRLTPSRLLQASMQEIKNFEDKLNALDVQVDEWKWDQINKIIRNLDMFIPHIGNLIEQYESLARCYSASSINSHKSGKTEDRRIVGNVIFSYLQRADATLCLGRTVQNVVLLLIRFVLEHKQDENYCGSLFEPLLKIICTWFKLAIESRINDQQAINDRGEGMIYTDEITDSSIRFGSHCELKATFSTPRCTEEMMNNVFYLAISWLVNGEIFYSRHQTKKHQQKPEYLATCSQLLMQLLQQYRSHPSFRNYMPCPETNNPAQNHLDYMKQLTFFEHIQHWDFVLTTLQRLTSQLPPSEFDVYLKDVQINVPERQGKDTREISMEAFKKSECLWDLKKLLLKQFMKQCYQSCRAENFYSLYEYLSVGINAGHRSFNYFGQKCADSLSSQVCDLNFESLRDLLTQFKYWVECMMDYDIVMTAEHVVAPSYLRAKERLEENVQQFDKIHRGNLEFLARQLQAEVANLAPKMAKRKSIKIHQRDSAGSLAEEGPPDVVREVIPSDTVSKDSETVSDIATVESIEREEIFLDEEGEWQQVKLGRRWIPVKTALKKLSEALLCHDLSDAVALLKSTNLNDAYQQLQNYLAEQDTLSIDVLMPLISGYLQVREMNRHVLCCEGLFPEIQPFVTSLMDNNQLTSRKIKEQFVAAMEKINPADGVAQEAFGNISTQISTLLDVQARATTLSDIAIMTALDILVTSAQLAQERLDHFRNIVINAWKRRYRLLMQHYPQRIRVAKTDKKANDPMAVMLTNDQAFKQYKSAFEKHQVVYQQKRTVVLGMEQSSSDLLRWLQAQVVPMDFPARLAAWNLSLEEVPSITTLGHRIDFIDNHIPDDDALRVDMLARVAHRLDIELSVYSFSSNEVRKLARTQDKPQTAQRPPLSNFFTQPFVSNDSERISAIRGYFHANIPSVLADFNSSETGMPVVLTGSMAFQHHISSLWDNTPDSPLQHLYRQTAQHLPRGITLQCMRASMTPRDTDLVVLNHSQVDTILEKLKTALEQIRLRHRELGSESCDVRIAPPDEPASSFGKVITTNRILVVSPLRKHPENLSYVVDVTKGLYPDQPSHDHYVTRVVKDGHIHIRRIDDIILDELNVIRVSFAGIERMQKAITRLFMIAFLECQQPKLDSVSRMALLHALNSLPGEDSVITELAEQLRQRPFYLVCHEDRCQSARNNSS